MFPRSHFLALSLLTAVFATVESNAQQLLRWRMSPGERMQVAIQQDINAEATLLGTEMKSTAEMLLLMNWKVGQVAPDGTAEIQQSVAQFRMKMSSPGHESIEFDTATPDKASGMAKMLLGSIQPMIGLNILQRMNSRGEILDVRLSEEAKQQLQRGATGELQQMFSADGLKSLLSQSAAVLPEQPVRPGDTWNGSANTETPAGKLLIDLAYVYEGTVEHQGRPLERINVALKMQVDENQPNSDMNVSISEQTGSGSMLFDARAGRFVQTQLQQRLILNTQIGQQTQTQKLATDMHIDFRLQPRAGVSRQSSRSLIHPVSTAN